MKNKSLFFLLTAACATPAWADVTVDITGSSAFRSATISAIKSRYDASGAPYQFAHDQAAGAYTGATRIIFKGSFPGVSGTTVIRTSFSGSVEGIRALIFSPADDASYYANVPGNFVTAATIGGGETHTNTVGFGKTTENAQAEIAFSDVSKNSTPFSSYSLLPANASAGVVVFTMLTNEGSPITNITSQQFRAVMKTGFQPLSLFTGNAADNPQGASPGANAAYVFATGRNDGSGTRTTYLAETNYGVSNVVKQYIPVTTTADAIEAIQLVPEGGVNDSDPATPGIQLPPGSDIKAWQTSGKTVTQSTANASTVWGQDQGGNGGYSSGSSLRGDMGKTSTSIRVFDELGNDAFGQSLKGHLVTFLSISDSRTARDAGGVLCAYNGVKLTDFAVSGSTLSAADTAKVTEGSYTAWGYQQMYRRNDLVTGDTVTVYNGIKNALPANLGSAGIPITAMSVGRETDGGIVAP